MGRGTKVCRARIQCWSSSPEERLQRLLIAQSPREGEQKSPVTHACDSGKATKQLPQLGSVVGKGQEGVVDSGPQSLPQRRGSSSSRTTG